MPGRKSNGTETRGQFSARLSFQFVTPCPGHLAKDFFADRGLRRVDQGRGSVDTPPHATPEFPLTPRCKRNRLARLEFSELHKPPPHPIPSQTHYLTKLQSVATENTRLEMLTF